MLLIKKLKIKLYLTQYRVKSVRRIIDSPKNVVSIATLKCKALVLI